MGIKVTVVVSVYDTEEYLCKCLESIINQTLKDIEIIVVNDGSPDRSIDIIREYEQKDSRIVVFDIENKGVSNARNLGLAHAGGEYIIFIDSDDYLNCDMLEIMYNEITGSGSDMAVCNFARVFDDYSEGAFLTMPKEKIIDVGEDNYAFASGVIGLQMHLGGCVWNKLFKTEFLKGTGILFEERDKIYAEDAFFYFKILKHLKKVCIIDKPLYNYYQRQTSVSNCYKLNLAVRCASFVEEIEKYYDDLRLEGVFKIRSFSFFIEVLINEIRANCGYSHFKNSIGNNYFAKKFLNMDTSDFSKNQKLIYFLYRYKMYFLIYAILKILKRG